MRKKRVKLYRKSYFVMPCEAIEKYRTREISAVDLYVYAALCNLRREYDGVRVSQKRLAFMTELTPKTISVSVTRLYNSGLLTGVYTMGVDKKKPRYIKGVYVYRLKPLPVSGYFFVPRHIFFRTNITPKMFAVYLFMCKAFDHEYEKSWNSYNDICVKLGFGKNQRSEIVKLIGELTALGLIKKKVRRIKKIFVDNIYRIIGFAEAVIEKEKRPVVAGTQFPYIANITASQPLPTDIVPPFRENVKHFYEQLSIFSEKIFRSGGRV
jgi:predicted transcriptional regulator